MNREQRRRAARQKNFHSVAKPKNSFADATNQTLLESIGLLIEELQKRGQRVYDFDNKEKYLQGFKILNDKIYF